MGLVCVRETVKGNRCCFCGGKSGFANLLAIFAEVSECVTKQGITDEAYPAFQKWYFTPGTLESQAVEGKMPKSSCGAALLQETRYMWYNQMY